MDDRIFANPSLFRTWLWCLMKANHQDGTWVPVKSGRGIDERQVARGQFIFGRFEAGKQLNLKPTTARNHIKKLEKLQFIDTHIDRQWTLITIRNYSDYSGRLEESCQPSENQAKTQRKPSENLVPHLKNSENSEKEEKYKDKKDASGEHDDVTDLISGEEEAAKEKLKEQPRKERPKKEKTRPASQRFQPTIKPSRTKGPSQVMDDPIMLDTAAQKRFDAFWGAYPARDGRKAGWQAAIERFVRLSDEEQGYLSVAATNYAASSGVAEGWAYDAKNFIRAKDGGIPWRDWMEAETQEQAKAHMTKEERTMAVGEALKAKYRQEAKDRAEAEARTKELAAANGSQEHSTTKERTHGHQ